MDARSLRSLHLSFAGVIYNLGITAKVGCLLLILCYALSFIFDPLQPLAVTPGYLIPPSFWIWTVVTHPFIETHLALLLCSLVAVILSSNFLESSFGTVKLLIYYGIVCVASSICSALFYFFAYMVTFNVDYLFSVHVNGMSGLLGGALVAIKQNSGDQPLVGAVGLQFKDMPLFCFVILAALKLFSFIPGGYVLAYGFGALAGWIYLRFYQNHSKGRGDQSEHFAFKYFFPKVVQGPVGVVSNIVYKFLLRLKICRKTVYRYDVGAPSNITLTLTGVNALDAERRRNKAIKALDERLKKSTSEANAAWPSLDNDDDDGEVSNVTGHSEPNVQQSVNKSTSQSSSPDGSASPDIVTIDMDSASPAENNA